MLRMLLWLTGLLLIAPTAMALCPGDCNSDGAVGIDELVRSVNIVLGALPLSACAAADLDDDSAVTVDEVLAAVNAALAGCPAGTPIAATATFTPRTGVTPTVTATKTPTSSLCGDGVVEGSEECDDGNRIDGDGCSGNCQLEPGGNVCAGVPTYPGAQPRAVPVASGLSQPLYVTAAPLDAHRVFIVEQPGRIRILKDGALLPTAFLDITDRVSCCGERGLLGLAFDPRYAQTERFFVDYTNLDGNTVIARYQVSADPNHADTGSERMLLTITQPFANHNGGQLAFGPDGYLYIGVGDGGSGGDPFNNAQSDDVLLGKLLRLDVDVNAPPYYAVPPGNPFAARGAPLGLIWAKGLRNPWRFSFDRLTGDLYIGDVGQSRIEEIDVQSAGSAGGANYGWRIFEGSSCFNPAPAAMCPAPPTGFTFPVIEYTHDDGCAVVGGFVYRGCALPDLRGTYFYGDFCSAFIRSFKLVNGMATAQHDWTAELALPGTAIGSIASFGEDTRGEIYVVDYDGSVFKIEPTP